jgi:molecular chaperone DnaK
MASDNRTLGRFQLMGIPPAPRGVPQIEVTFDIDANGILHVGAKDRGTGQEQKIEITSSSGLAEEEIERMVDEAKSHEGEDEKRRQQIDIRNKLDGLIYATEKLVNDNREKLPESDAKSIDDALIEAKKALEEGSVEEMEAAHEKLTQASHQVAAVLYQSASSESGGAPGSGPEAGAANGGEQSAAPDDDVIDAEYVDVDAEESS